VRVLTTCRQGHSLDVFFDFLVFNDAQNPYQPASRAHLQDPSRGCGRCCNAGNHRVPDQTICQIFSANSGDPRGLWRRTDTSRNNLAANVCFDPPCHIYESVAMTDRPGATCKGHQ